MRGGYGVHSPTSSQADRSASDLRFRFGSNWLRFLSTVDEERIREARGSLCRMLGVQDLRGKRFLDIGCGSGLFSLAARQLGASVRSFDADRDSVACARELKRRFCENDEAWKVEEGSVLDEDYLGSLGEFDVVYSWGVLHHTGNMMTALGNAAIPVASDGHLFIAIYNDQGVASKLWTKIKRTWCASPVGKGIVWLVFIPLFLLRSAAASLVRYGNPTGYFTRYKRRRGMSIYHDWIDWLGGYPFEVAKPEVIFHFYRERGLTLTNLTTTQRLGCNEFVFRKSARDT